MSFTVKGATPTGIEKDIRYNATDALLLACHLRARGMTDIQITNNTAIASMRSLQSMTNASTSHVAASPGL